MNLASDHSPKISIITPVFNRAHLIADTVATVQAQTCTDFEMIIVDDCSTDDIEAVVEDIAREDQRIRLVRRETNGGPSGARNTGVMDARGDYIAFLDSDDLWLPKKLEAQLLAASESDDSSNVFCVTQTRVVHGGGRADEIQPSRGVEAGERWANFLYVANQFAQCSSYFLSVELAKKISFDESLRQYEDHLYFLAAGGEGAIYTLVNEPLVVWHNDDRPGRMGSSDSIERGKAFMATAGDLLNEAESIAFQLRCLGPTLAEKDRLGAMSLVAKAAFQKGIPKEAWAKLLLSGAIGRKNYERLRTKMSG